MRYAQWNVRRKYGYFYEHNTAGYNNVAGLVCGLLILRWVALASTKAKNNDNSYDNYGEYCVTLGVLGTFIGITYSLLNFNASDSKELMDQIPQVIAGMKFAFITSLEGLVGSMLIKQIKAKQNENSSSLDELALKAIVDSDKRHNENMALLSSISVKQTEAIGYLSKMDLSPVSSISDSVKVLASAIKSSSQTELANSLSNLSSTLQKQNENVEHQSALISEQTKSINHLLEALSTGLKRQADVVSGMSNIISLGNAEQKLILESMAKTMKNVEESSQKADSASALMLKNTIEFQEKQNTFSLKQIEQMQQNTAVMQNLASKFDNFLNDMSEKFSDNFIASLRGLIENLNENLTEQFGENFKRLDESVKKLNQWQTENKEEISILTASFENVKDSFNRSLDKTIAFLDKMDKAEQVIHAIDGNIKELNIAVINLSQEQKLLAESTLSATAAASKIEDALAAVDGVCHSVNSQIKMINENIEHSYRDMIEQMSNMHDNFIHSVSDINNITGNELKTICKSTIEKLSQATTEAVSDFKTRSAEIASQLSSSAKNMIKDLNDNQAYITESTLDQLTDITSNIENNASSVIKQNKAIFDSMDEQVKSFETTITNSMKEIGTKIEEFTIDWDDNITEASQKISNAYIELARKNGEEQEKAILTLGKQLSAIAEKMAESYSDLNETLTLLNKQTKNMR